eukprot:6084909-Amphidinium_carterae.1
MCLRETAAERQHWCKYFRGFSFPNKKHGGIEDIQTHPIDVCSLDSVPWWSSIWLILLELANTAAPNASA